MSLYGLWGLTLLYGGALFAPIVGQGSSSTPRFDPFLRTVYLMSVPILGSHFAMQTYGVLRLLIPGVFSKMSPQWLKIHLVSGTLLGIARIIQIADGYVVGAFVSVVNLHHVLVERALWRI